MGFLFETICKKGFIDWSQSVPDVGGQHCPCPVLVSFVSGLAEKSCPVPVYCPDCVRIFVRFLFVRNLSVSIPSAVWIPSGFSKKSVRCLPVWSVKDEPEVSGLSMSLSADVWSVLEQIGPYQSSSLAALGPEI